MAAIREVREETGIIVASVDCKLGTYLSTSEGKRDTVHIFVATATDDRIPKLEIELQGARWYAFDDLPEKTTRPTRWRLQEYLAGLKNLSGSWTKNN